MKFGTTHGHGCCTHCSVGVAARLKQDIEVEAKDGLTGEVIRVKTLAWTNRLAGTGHRHCMVRVEERARREIIVKTVCGVPVMLGGLWLIYSAP